MYCVLVVKSTRIYWSITLFKTRYSRARWSQIVISCHNARVCISKSTVHPHTTHPPQWAQCIIISAQSVLNSCDQITHCVRTFKTKKAINRSIIYYLQGDSPSTFFILILSFDIIYPNSGPWNCIKKYAPKEHIFNY